MRQSAGFALNTSRDLKITSGFGLAREAIGPWHMIEVREQSELFQDQAGGRSTLGGRGRLSSAERCQRFHDTRINCGQPMAASGIELPVFEDELFNPLVGHLGKEVAEEIEQMTADDSS